MAVDPIEVRRVVVTDVDISFWNLVLLLVKLAFAAIPAAIVTFLIVAILIAALGAIGVGWR